MDKQPVRLTRWMLSHGQPAPLDLDHPAQEDIAWAADEILRLTAELEKSQERERVLRIGIKRATMSATTTDEYEDMLCRAIEQADSTQENNPDIDMKAIYEGFDDDNGDG